MDIQCTQLANTLVVKVSGRMDAENADRFEHTCEEWVGRGATRILADLTDLQYVSSAGLSGFLAVSKALQPKSGSLILCGLHGLPRQVFEMTRLILLFSVFDTTEAALASLPGA
jgi:anti-sigma B factor antagonist